MSSGVTGLYWRNNRKVVVRGFQRADERTLSDHNQPSAGCDRGVVAVRYDVQAVPVCLPPAF